MTDSVPVSIRGEVERPACLGPAELRSLMDAELVADFHCRDGWSRLGDHWRGVRLATLLALAGAADAAGYVTVGSGEYTAVLTREQAEDERVLLALEHEGAGSPRSAGFPRLIGPSDWDCFLSVKSVDRVEVTREPRRATAETIALARAGSRSESPGRNRSSSPGRSRPGPRDVDDQSSTGEAPPLPRTPTTNRNSPRANNAQVPRSTGRLRTTPTATATTAANPAAS